MNEKWLDVTIADNVVYISDWTHTMKFLDRMRNSKIKDGHKWEQDYWRFQKDFVTVKGKTHTYHVKGLGLSNEQCKAIAIRYHVERTNGNISKYRLD